MNGGARGKVPGVATFSDTGLLGRVQFVVRVGITEEGESF